MTLPPKWDMIISRSPCSFVDGYLAAIYPAEEAERFQKLSETQPIGRMAKPDEIAALALYRCSDEAGFVTGSAYPIDGGAVNVAEPFSLAAVFHDREHVRPGPSPRREF